MLGRNELCPCGSGKKYKKCCLNKDTASEISNRKVSNSQQQYLDLCTKIQEYANKDEFKVELEKAKSNFYIIDNDEINSKFDKFFSTYFAQDHIMEDKKVLSVKFFEDNRHILSRGEVEVLKGLFESYVSVYKIKQIKDGEIILEDYLANTEVATQDINLLKGFKEGDAIIARVVNIEGTNILVDITISISNDVKDIIVNDMRTLFEKHKEVYKDMKTFLIYYTHILYKYMQQLLDQSIAQYLKETTTQVKETEEVVEVKKESQEDCKVISMLKENIEKEYLSNGIEFWNIYKANHPNLKGAENGWAAAIEYHIKREAGQSVTQAQISKKYDVSASTVGKRYKDFKLS